MSDCFKFNVGREKYGRIYCATRCGPPTCFGSKSHTNQILKKFEKFDVSGTPKIQLDFVDGGKIIRRTYKLKRGEIVTKKRIHLDVEKENLVSEDNLRSFGVTREEVDDARSVAHRGMHTNGIWNEFVIQLLHSVNTAKRRAGEVA